MWDASYTWLVLLLVFILAEVACPIHLVSIWFALGAVVAMTAAALGAAMWLQVTLFVVVSCALLFSLWPFVRKVLNPNLKRTNVDSVIGATGIVTAQIDNLEALGQVKLGGMPWSARSTSGEPIPEGTTVRVDRIEGVKVFVTPVESEVKV